MWIYKTKGTCSREIIFDIADGILKDVKFVGGCDGNLEGLSRLLKGMPVDEAIKRLKGVDCRGKGTSCPDQLAKALEEAVEKSQTNTQAG